MRNTLSTCPVSGSSSASSPTTPTSHALMGLSVARHLSTLLELGLAGLLKAYLLCLDPQLPRLSANNHLLNPLVHNYIDAQLNPLCASVIPHRMRVTQTHVPQFTRK